MNIKERFSWLVGLDYDKAKVLMSDHKPFFVYPDSIDGKSIVRTHDLNPNRIGIIVKNNKIIELTEIG